MVVEASLEAASFREYQGQGVQFWEVLPSHSFRASRSQIQSLRVDLSGAADEVSGLLIAVNVWSGTR